MRFAQRWCGWLGRTNSCNPLSKTTLVIQHCNPCRRCNPALWNVVVVVSAQICYVPLYLAWFPSPTINIAGDEHDRMCMHPTSSKQSNHARTGCTAAQGCADRGERNVAACHIMAAVSEAVSTVSERALSLTAPPDAIRTWFITVSWLSMIGIVIDFESCYNLWLWWWHPNP